MRTILFAAVVSAAACFGANASPAPDAGAFPHDKAALRDLDSQQLRIVRRAGAMCWHSGEGGFLNPRGPRARACIISLTESAIRNSDDPVLQAYHQALPFHARYDEYRPGYYWQRLVSN